MAISETQENQILKLIVGLFHGGIDPGNLSALANIIDSGASFLDLSKALAATSVFKEHILDGNVTEKSHVDILMKNFGLTADDDPTSPGSQAEAFFTARISQGADFGEIVFEAVNFLSQENLATEFVPVATLLNNKALISKAYVETNPPADVSTLISLLSDVKETNPFTTTEVSDFIGKFASNKILLTSQTDNLTGSSGIDIYSAVFDPEGNASTISNSDTLDGKEAVDQLSIRIGSVQDGNQNSTIAPVSSNIENFYLTNQSSSGSFTLNFANITGESKVWDKDSVSGAHTKLINLDSAATVGMSNTLGLFSAHFSGESERTGNTDAFTLELNGAGSASQFTVFSTTTDTDTNDASFEIAHISSTENASYISLGLNKMTLSTLNISGDAALLMDEHNDFTGLSTVYASSMTAGGVDIDASDSEEANFTFIGSSANDRIILKNSTINSSSSLNGGEGTDTLATKNFNNLTASEVNRATGIEVLEGYEGAENFSASDFTTINNFVFTGTGSSNNGFTLSDVENSDRIKYATDISSGGSYALRVEGKNAGNTATIELHSLDQTNGETVITASSNNNERYGIELRSNIATLTIDSTGTGTNANVIDTNQDNNDFGYAIGNSSTSVFSITGSHDLSIMAKAGVDVSDGSKLAGFSSAANIDASTFTGVLRIAGSLSDDVIKGGSNSDIIYSLGGADTLTGNGGSDQFRLAEFFNQTDIILDFNQDSDKVGLNEFDFSNTSATQAGANLSTEDYVENRLGITNIGSADEHKVIELQSSLSNDQISSDTGAAIEAFVVVHNTTSGKAELWYDNDWSTSSNRDHVITFDNITDLTGVQSFDSADFVEYTF